MASNPAATDRSTRQTDATRLDSCDDCNHRPLEKGTGESRCWNGGNVWRKDGGARRSWPALVSRGAWLIVCRGDTRTAQSGTRGWRASRCSTPPGPGSGAGKWRSAGRGAGWWSGENCRERAESWHRGCCSCWALLVRRGRVVMACCSNRRGREEEAAPFREGLNWQGERGRRTREEVGSRGGRQA